MVKFKYDSNQEIEEVLWHFSDYADFKKQGYDIILPKISVGLKKKLISGATDKVTIDEFKAGFSKIFSSESLVYKKTKDEVEQNWRKIETEFFNTVSDLFPNKKNTYTCYLSRYGPGGAYFPPTSISARVIWEKKSELKEANEKIAHELIHLFIYKKAEVSKLCFEDIERLVDLILSKTPIANLLHNPKMQGMGDKRLDDFFVSNSFNLDKTLRNYRGQNRI